MTGSRFSSGRRSTSRRASRPTAPPGAPDRRARPRGHLRRGARPAAALTRLTFDDQSDFSPVWSPDGARILHGSISNNLYFFSIRNADGSGTPRKVYEAPRRASSRSPRRGRRTARPCSSTSPRGNGSRPAGAGPGERPGARACVDAVPRGRRRLLPGRPLRRVLGRQPGGAAGLRAAVRGRRRALAALERRRPASGLAAHGRDRVPAPWPADQRLDLRAGSHQRRVLRGRSPAGALPRTRRTPSR